MTMSRKHYTKAAAIIAGERAGAASTLQSAEQLSPAWLQANGALKATKNIALSLADMFAQDNSAFQRDRFYDAAGITDPYSPTGVAA